MGDLNTNVTALLFTFRYFAHGFPSRARVLGECARTRLRTGGSRDDLALSGRPYRRACDRSRRRCSVRASITVAPLKVEDLHDKIRRWLNPKKILFIDHEACSCEKHKLKWTLMANCDICEASISCDYSLIFVEITK